MEDFRDLQVNIGLDKTLELIYKDLYNNEIKWLIPEDFKATLEARSLRPSSGLDAYRVILEYDLTRMMFKEPEEEPEEGSNQVHIDKETDSIILAFLNLQRAFKKVIQDQQSEISTLKQEVAKLTSKVEARKE